MCALIATCLWKYDAGDCMEKEMAMESWRRVRLIFPLEALGTNGVESWFFFTSLVISMLCDLFAHDLKFILCLVHGHALFLWYYNVFGFSWFSSCSFLLCFGGLGNSLGKEGS